MPHEFAQKAETLGIKEADILGQIFAHWRANFPSAGPQEKKRVIRSFIANSPWQEEGEGLVDYLASRMQSRASRKGWAKRKAKETREARAQQQEIRREHLATLQKLEKRLKTLAKRKIMEAKYSLSNLGHRLEKSGPKAIAKAEKREREPSFL